MDYMPLKAANKTTNYQEINAGATYLKSRPLFFWFDLNGSCNLECKHCGFNVFGRTSEHEVSEPIYQTILSDLMPTAYVCNLGGTNWGEMTTAKIFHRFLQDCKKYQVRINLTTNGTRLSDDWFDDLLDTLTVIGFSMEGIEAEFEKIRGFKWRFFLKHVEKICQGRVDRGKSFRVEWRFCAHADNIHQLPQMIRLAKSIGVDRIQIMNLTPYVPGQKYKMLYFHRSKANQYFAEARAVARDLDIDVNIPPDFDNGTFETNLIQIGGVGRPAEPAMPALEMVNCYHPWQTCSINELGDVKPCCVYWRKMGSLEGRDFEAVWNGRRYRRLRAAVNAPNPDRICHSCRRPQFDSEENKSFAQLVPSLRELTRNLLSPRSRPKVVYTGVMNEEYDPSRRVEEEVAAT